ncbi:MAG: helix-turn-helix domain-containing protein [Deltaproteobacteria bacterium]|nr:helix-turn-helix domain-containing protein [Deltaproteobacteria bacterium]
MATNNNELISTAEAARRLGVRPQTLRKWRYLGNGPRFVRIGQLRTGRAVYRPSDLEAWLMARTFTSTAAESAAEDVGGCR